MKYFSFLLFSCFLWVNCQNTSAPTASEVTANPAKQEELGYDAKLAEECGADEYGMRQYVLAYLKRGPNTNQ